MGEGMMIQQLNEALLSNNIEEACSIAQQLPFNALQESLMLFAYETKNIFTYTVVVSLLLKEESINYHSLASTLFMQPLCSLEGAYLTSLFHARRCAELAPENIDYREDLLFFYGLPDKVLSNKEALQIARDVIRVKPDSTISQRVIKEIGLQGAN